MRKASRITIPMCALAMAVSAYANANTPPTADFSISIKDNYIKVKSMAADSDDDPLKYKWTFGDGKSAVSVNPGHTYAQEGVYQVRLKVSDGQASAEKAKDIRIPNSSPVSDFEFEKDPLKPMKFKFTSLATDPENDAIKVKWSFGDGKTSTVLNPAHTFARAGTYTVTLSVNDGYHAAVKKSMEITVTDNHAPEAGFTVTKPRKDNKFYVKAISTASDEDNDPLKYRWDFGDGKTSTAENPGHTYTDLGVYTITQVVSDGAATTSHTEEIVIQNEPPVAGFTVKTKKLRASFASTATDADEGDTLTYKWNFGDRSTSTLKDPAHVYPKSGTYTVKHTVSDGYTSATYEKTITVSAELSADFTVDISRGLAITADPAVDMEDNVEYIWSFGDGSGSQEISPSHIYDEPGTYEITLTVRDGDFSEAVQTRTVTVERKLPFKLSGHVGLPGSDLVKAKVCLDVNRDFVCSANEPVTVTDANGNYVFDTYAPVADSPFACAEDNSCIQDALPLAVIAYTNQDSAKFVHGTEIPLRDNEVMSLTSFVPVSAIMSGASAGTNFDVNQFTTVTDYALKDLPQLSQLTLGVAYAWVLNLFDLTAQAVTEGTNQALITGEIASRSGILPNSLARLRDFQESAFTAQNMFSVADRDAMAADIAAVISSTDLGDDAAVANAVYTYSEDAEYSLTKLAGHNADDFKCGMSKARNVYCWGNNSWASLGDPSIFPVDEDGEYVKYGASVKNNFSADLIKVKTSENEYLSNVKTFDVGNTHVCAVTFDGSVWCWGDNWYGQTGNGTVGNRTMYARKVLKGQQEIKGDYLGKIESLTLAHNVSCALTDSGEVYCWGENTALQLGASHPDLEIKAKEGIESRDGIDLTDIVKAVPTPVKVVFPDTVSGVSELTAGVSAFCALTENTSENDRHNVYCWGNDTRGLVSHNWMQYQDDWLMKYANKTLFRDRGIYTLADPNGTKPSAWKVTEDYGDYHFGDYHFLYGQPVTQIKRFTDGNSSFDLVNVTHLGISEFDYNLIVERDNDGELYYSHNNGTADHTYHRIMTTSKITFNGEKIAKLDINAEDKVSFALSDKGKLYAFNGSNIYGVWGIGSDVPYDSFSMEPKNDDGTGLWVVYPEIPNLTGVVDVSVGKRSVCAAVKRSGENSNSAGGTDTYCWGSSTFGQLGFDNRDGGFSYYDALGSYITYKDSTNQYYDKKTRIVTRPRKIELPPR